MKETKKDLLQKCCALYGSYSVNEFVKKCLSLSVAYKDFFFDILTGVVEASYSGECRCERASNGV